MFYGCKEEMPTLYDGFSGIKISAIWDSSYNDSHKFTQANNARVIIASEYGTQELKTDENGELTLLNLPAAEYTISIVKDHPKINGIILTGDLSNIQVKTQEIFSDTVELKPTSSSGLVLNEIYFSGPVNSTFYTYDQFIEIYNSSDSIKFLDGMMLMRFSGNSDVGMKGPGADENNDGDIDGVTNIYKFPGEPGEENYSIKPHTFLIIASDAIDHTSIVSTSINLSGSDWEFFNQYAADDVDNPDVPNLINLRSEITTDFLMNINTDVIVLTKGNDKNWSDGIDISDIIDAVEYQPLYGLLKTLDERVDRSFVLSPPKYSGKSIERREPGLDTNNGLIDWEIIQTPTPGYQ